MQCSGEIMTADINKIILAYSGGLDTSVILTWLEEKYQCPVIAYAADVGQTEDWDKVKEKGLARLEGKTYAVQDGDIINFKFNV